MWHARPSPAQRPDTRQGSRPVRFAPADDPPGSGGGVCCHTRPEEHHRGGDKRQGQNPCQPDGFLLRAVVSTGCGERGARHGLPTPATEVDRCCRRGVLDASAHGQQADATLVAGATFVAPPPARPHSGSIIMSMCSDVRYALLHDARNILREIDGGAYGARRSIRRDNRSMFSWSTARICGFCPSGWR